MTTNHEPKEVYCLECGEKLLYKGLRGAENFGPFGGHKFNRKGKRLLNHWYECPNIYVKLFGIKVWHRSCYKHTSIALGPKVER